MDYTLRPLEEDDWSELVEIFYQAIQSNHETFSISCPSYEDWDKKHHKSCRLAAEQDAELAAWAALAPVSDEEAYQGVAEASLFIDAGHKDTEVGKLLLKALLESSEKEGFWTVQVCLFDSNPDGIRLFEDCGFRRVGVRERMGKDRFGSWRSLVLLEHRIQTDIEGGCDCEMVRAMKRECKDCCC